MLVETDKLQIEVFSCGKLVAIIKIELMFPMNSQQLGKEVKGQRKNINPVVHILKKLLEEFDLPFLKQYHTNRMQAKITDAKLANMTIEECSA